MSRRFIMIAIIGAALYWWQNHKEPLDLMEGPTGFMPVMMPGGAKPNVVVILAPKNCPSDAAKRADALAARLTEMGIPNVRGSNFSAQVEGGKKEDEAALERSILILNGEVPAVFINRSGKANPTADEVAAEYRRTKSN